MYMTKSCNILDNILHLLPGDRAPGDEHPLGMPWHDAALHQQPERLTHKALRAIAVDRVVKGLFGNHDAGLSVGVG